jgi:hypothetical protein
VSLARPRISTSPSRLILRGIVATCRDDLDIEQARSFLRLLEQALDRSDLVSELDRALGGDRFDG